MKRAAIYVAALGFGLVSPCAVYGCDAPTVVSPIQFAQAQTVRPTVAWLPVPSATGYEVEATIYRLEGEIIVKDKLATTSTAYQLPPSQALRRALAVVSVSARCGDANSRAAERRFILDASGSCPTPVFRVTQVGGTARIEFDDPSPADREIEARLFSGGDARPGELIAGRRSPLIVDIPEARPWILGPRSRCRVGVGEWEWVQDAIIGGPGAAASSRSQ